MKLLPEPGDEPAERASCFFPVARARPASASLPPPLLTPPHPTPPLHHPPQAPPRPPPTTARLVCMFVCSVLTRRRPARENEHSVIRTSPCDRRTRLATCWKISCTRLGLASSPWTASCQGSSRRRKQRPSWQLSTKRRSGSTRPAECRTRCECCRIVELCRRALSFPWLRRRCKSTLMEKVKITPLPLALPPTIELLFGNTADFFFLFFISSAVDHIKSSLPQSILLVFSSADDRFP